MKSIIAILMLCILSACVAPKSSKDEAYMRAVIANKEAYFRATLAGIDKADSAVLFLLKPSADEGVRLSDPFSELQDKFPIRPYDRAVEIIKKKKLSKAETHDLISEIKRIMDQKNYSDGPFCHNPSYGIRLFSRDQMIFESSFSWDCGNYYLAFPDGSAEWISIHEFKSLRAMIEAFLPPNAK